MYVNNYIYVCVYNIAPKTLLGFTIYLYRFHIGHVDLFQIYKHIRYIYIFWFEKV